MSLIVVDVESDGPIPHKYSMVSFGAVVVSSELSDTFYAKVKPISELWVPEALAISGHTREEHKTFQEPEEVMKQFATWIKIISKGRPIFISDNPAFNQQVIMEWEVSVHFVEKIVDGMLHWMKLNMNLIAYF